MPDHPQGRLHTTAIRGDISATLLALLRSLATQPCHHAGYLRQTLEQVLLAVQGNVEETLARAEAADRDDVAIAAAYDVAKAHALACSGDDEGAKKALLAVRESAGKQALERAR